MEYGTKEPKTPPLSFQKENTEFSWTNLIPLAKGTLSK